MGALMGSRLGFGRAALWPRERGAFALQRTTHPDKPPRRNPVAQNVALAPAAAETAGQIIDYRSGTPDALRDEGRQCDAVCALVVIEHVPDRRRFLQALSALARPSGLLFITTIDRTLLSWLMAIVAAEKILGILPSGTHRLDWFVHPPEAQAVLAGEGLMRIDFARACGICRCSIASAGRPAPAWTGPVPGGSWRRSA